METFQNGIKPLSTLEADYLVQQQNFQTWFQINLYLMLYVETYRHQTEVNLYWEIFVE